MSYSEIRRGPMAADNFAQLHNRLFRSGGAITPTEVAVFGHIATHRQGWKISAKQVARGVGVSAPTAKKALAGLRAKHLLLHHQERDERGRVGTGSYFITDLRFQLLDAGITDEVLIAERVQAAFDTWIEQNPRSEPGSKSFTPDEPDNDPVTDNSPLQAPPEPPPGSIDAGQNRSKETRTTDKPHHGDLPDKEHHPAREHQSSEDQNSEENQGGSPSPVGAPRERASEDPPHPEPRSETPYDPRNPRCKAHRHIPLDDPGPPCGSCKDAKRWQAGHEAEVAAAAAKQVRECPMCGPDGSRLDTRRGRLPLSPARSCDHTTPLPVVLAEIAEQEELLERHRADVRGEHQEFSSAEVRRRALASIPKARPVSAPEGQTQKSARTGAGVTS